MISPEQSGDIKKNYCGHKIELFLDNLGNQELDNLRDHKHLDARALYPDSSLADLYDELTMPPELRKAHIANDKAVMAAYGFGIKMTEEECVAELMKLYQKMQR